MNPRQTLDRRQFSLCCLTVLAALLPHASWLPMPLFAVLLVLLLLRWWQRTRWPGNLHGRAARTPSAAQAPKPWPWWFHTGLMLCLFIGAWSSIGTISGTQGAGFLAAMLVSKLFEAERVRDARSVATFASFLVMAHFLFQSELWTLFAAIPGALLAIATLASLHRAPGPRAFAVAPALADAGRLLAIALPLAMLMFLLFPRLESPLWGDTFGVRGNMGLSDRMEPGQLGQMAQDDRTAMRVRFPDGVPPARLRYFRGVSLWTTDGRAWTRPHWSQAPERSLAPVPDRGIRHEITLEADAAPWLPALDRPIAAPDGLYLSVDHSLPLRRNQISVRYEVVSDPDLPLDALELPPQMRDLGLYLPQQRNPRTHEMAQRMRAQSDSDQDYAERLLRVFANDFFYTLNPPPLGMHSVDEFLFDTQAGYCEHYASAYATLLRAGGVPARVVLGYQGGYYNRMGDFLVVRRSDAHAWVEVWIEQRGWLRTDPTAMVPPERILDQIGGDSSSQLDGLANAGANLWHWMQDRWQFLEMRWTDWVVNYRAIDQTALIEHVLSWLPSSTPALAVMLAVAVFGTLVAMLWWLRDLRPAERRLQPMAIWLARLRRILAGADLPSSASEPASSLLTRAGHRYPALKERLGTLSLRYQNQRYGTRTDLPAPNRTDLIRLWLQLRRHTLAQAIQRSPGRPNAKETSS